MIIDELGLLIIVTHLKRRKWWRPIDYYRRNKIIEYYIEFLKERNEK